MVSRIRRDPELLDALRTMLTINVTEFFRDSGQWRVLAEKVLPEILARTRTPKVWSAGCSHGGEPFSIAMLLAEAGAGPGSAIVATDLDRRVLERARSGGPYGAHAVAAVSPALRARDMNVEDGVFRVRQEIRRAVRFRELNLLQDPFPRSIDLIVCRNVIIYFTGPVKDDLMVRFRQSLSPEGVLFIGGTELILNADEAGFERLETHFYRKPSGPESQRAA